MHYLYILQSQRTGQYYVGSSEDVSRRLNQHNGELPRLGRSRVAGRPWKLVFEAEFASRAQAMAAEKYVKRMKSKHWVAKLITGEYALPSFSPGRHWGATMLRGARSSRVRAADS